VNRGWKAIDKDALKSTLEISGVSKSVTYEYRDGAPTVNFETGAITGGTTASSFTAVFTKAEGDSDGRPDISGGNTTATAFLWAENEVGNTFSVRDNFTVDSERYEVVSTDILPGWEDTTLLGAKRVD